MTWLRGDLPEQTAIVCDCHATVTVVAWYARTAPLPAPGMWVARIRDKYTIPTRTMRCRVCRYGVDRRAPLVLDTLVPHLDAPPDGCARVVTTSALNAVCREVARRHHTRETP